MEEACDVENSVVISVEPSKSRWALQEEEDTEMDEDDGEYYAADPLGADPEDEDNPEQRLIRTGPRIDSFDVEALEIPGAQRNGYDDFSSGKKIILAFQTLGVVFGDIGTSPLYTFSVMFSKAPITDRDDILGALSLVLYTLILVPLVKYVLVVLWANDDGEGGTFALYSLICRHAKVSLLPNQLPSDSRISSFRLKVPSPELERSLKIKERLEASLTLKRLLLVLVLAGTSMVITVAVVTPAMSVMSVIGGLKIGISGLKEDETMTISVAFLVILFSVQKYGTSKVGLAVGPTLLLWFCSLAGIGIYNLLKHDTSVLRAFNPVYIYIFFRQDLKNAWLSLGGCLLCATGSEAMFADLCYFPVRSVQLTFIFLVLPCLMLGYLGQAAYLMENPSSQHQPFFTSIPNAAFWPVLLIAAAAALIASRAMTTATFSCIKQSTSLGCFPRLKIVHTSRKFMGQIYIPVVNWSLLALCLAVALSSSTLTDVGDAYAVSELGVMATTTVLVTLVMLLIWRVHITLVLAFAALFLGAELLFLSSSASSAGGRAVALASLAFVTTCAWNYGSKLRYETEVRQKLPPESVRALGPSLGTVRSPGIALLYNELVRGIPSVFGHFLTTLPAVHSVIILVCIKYVPVPVVPQGERFLFRRLCPKSYRLFRCVARYGYKDVRKEDHQAFEQLLTDSLEKFIRREAIERSLESDNDDDPPSPARRNGDLRAPLLRCHVDDGPPVDPDTALEDELLFVRAARDAGIVYLLGHGDIRARKDSWFIKKLVINYFYAFLRRNCRRGIANLSVPHSHLIQVGMTYMV